jgi:hypothetical protein
MSDELNSPGQSPDDRRLASLVDNLRREREARKPKLLDEGGSSQIRLGMPWRCPFDHALLAGRTGVDGLPLTDDESSRCIAAARRRPSEVLDAVTVLCAGVSLAGGVRPAYRILAHSHADLLIEGHRVHLEGVYQELGGAGGIGFEIRVYVDHLLQGRGRVLRRLGGTVMALPAVAHVAGDLFVSVDAVHPDSMSELIVEVRRRARKVQPHSPERPLTVTTGILTEAEFQQLTSQDQQAVEECARDMLVRYGEAQIRKDWRRHRDDIEFLYGV